MGIKDKAETAAKNIEAKAQEMMGEVTGDSQDKIEGQAKQAQAEAEQAKENVKDSVKDAID
ncbi:MAG: CsbD family protein [Prochloraceae cyanobacterium]|nr:CsbD family protein [Prochloraceae cyanobacterium]